MAIWPYTNQNRYILEFDGDGDAIWTQGNEIRQLGFRMEFASDTLRQLASGEDGQQGEAVDALREKVGDADVTLALAAELYKPLGTALKEYGNEVRNTIKTEVDTRFQTAHDRWTEYIALPGDKDGRDYFLGIGKPEEGSQEEADNEAEDQAKLNAWNDWEDAADAYDTAYDTWEDAWDKAIETIEDAFSDDLKDSRWEDVKGWINVALEVLKWAGLVVGIAALIIGGPIIAAVAAAIAVATLVLTVVMAIDGDGSWTDVAWAAVDLIPFGKAGKLFRRGSGNVSDFAGDMFGNFKFAKLNDGVSGWSRLNPRNWSPAGVYGDGWDAVKKFPTEGFAGNRNGREVLESVLTGKNQRGWDKMRLDHFNFEGMPRHLAAEGWINEFAVRNAGATWEEMHTLIGHGFKLEGWHNTIENQFTGGDDTSWRNSNPITKVIW